MPHLAVSLVGGGGKTSVMYQLAMELAERGKRVIVTTSTHLAWPEFPNREFPGSKFSGMNPDVPVFLKEEMLEKEFLQILDRQLKEHAIVIAGGQELWKTGEHGEQIHKIKGLPVEVLDALKPLCDVLLIEADGARHLPFKIPADHEPVLSAGTDAVIGCVGLDCIGRPWEEQCFRWELAEKMWKQDQEQEMSRITSMDVSEVLCAEWGTKKRVGNRPFAVVLNKADDEFRRNEAAKIGKLLKEKNILCVMTCFYQ